MLGSVLWIGNNPLDNDCWPHCILTYLKTLNVIEKKYNINLDSNKNFHLEQCDKIFDACWAQVSIKKVNFMQNYQFF